jgi:thiamine biosynthesis protein ThiS
MELVINGSRLTFAGQSLDLAGLFRRLDLEQPEFAGVVVNGTPVDVAERRSLLLRDGDRVEILPYLGGG